MRTEGSARLAAALTPPVMSQSELARRLNVTPQAVSGWVQGKSTPSPEYMVKIEDLLGIPMRAWTESEPAAHDSGEIPAVTPPKAAGGE